MVRSRVMGALCIAAIVLVGHATLSAQNPLDKINKALDKATKKIDDLTKTDDGSSKDASKNSMPAVASRIGEYVFLDPLMAGLLELRDNPDLITDERLIKATQGQIAREQAQWEVIKNMTTPNSGSYAREIGKNPVVSFEWQTLQEQQSAIGASVADAFLYPDAAWPFVSGDKRLTQPGNVIGVFLFSRDKVEGRDARFAARDLAPVFRKHLETLIPKASTKFWLTVALPTYDYDFGRSALRFSKPPTKDAKASVPNELLMGISTENGEVHYSLVGPNRLMPVSGQGPWHPKDAVMTSSVQYWRDNLTAGKFPYVDYLALKRRLVVETVPLEPAKAEALMKAKTPLQARVFIDAAGIESRSGQSDDGIRFYGVIHASVPRIELVTPDGTVVTTLAGDTLPAVTMAAPTPAKTPTKGKPLKKVPPSPVRKRPPQAEME